MSSFKTGWYVIYTRPCHEKKVSNSLELKKLDYYLPTVKTLRTWHDRRKYIEVPLFPSYIFIHLANTHAYYEGLNVDGAVYYVKTGKEPARVSDTIINNIKLLTGVTDEVKVTDHAFVPGQQMVIHQGPLTGLCCEVVQYDSKATILVRVNLLQRNVLVTLPAENLMPVSGQALLS